MKKVILGLIWGLLILMVIDNVSALTNVNSCQFLPSNEVYHLTNDIINATSMCFTFGSNVTLDCLGHMVDGTGTGGTAYKNYTAIMIRYGEINNVTIKNCIITEWERGMEARDGEFSDILIQNSQFSFSRSGIEIDNTNGFTVNNVSVHDMVIRGLSIGDSSNILIGELEVYYVPAEPWGWDSAFDMDDVENVLVKNSYFRNNDFGFTIGQGSTYAYLRNVTIKDTVIKDNNVYDLGLQVYDALTCHEGIYLENVNGTGDLPIFFFNQSVNLYDWNNNFSAITLCDADNSRLVNVTSDVGMIGVLHTDNSYFENLDLHTSLFSPMPMIMSNNNIITNSKLKITGSNYVFTLAPSAVIHARYSSGNVINNSVLEGSGAESCMILDNCGIFGENRFYNNLFNCSIIDCWRCEYFNGVYPSYNIYPNYWNVTKTSRQNIVGGPYMGGNYYTNSGGTYYSDICNDTDRDGLCDNPFVIDSNNIDYLPLSDEFEVIPFPNATEFSPVYGSTNFSAVPDVTDVTNMTLANQYGKIQFSDSYSVDASGEDYDTHIEIGDGFISVNTPELDSTFNSSATLTLNNITCPAIVYFAPGNFTSKEKIIEQGKVCTDETDPSCTNISCVDKTLTFTVSHFTGFAYAEERSCEMKTDYMEGVDCASTTVVVHNDEELEDYLTDYGFDDNRYQNLKIKYNISKKNIEIHSPCKIKLKESVVLTADTICLDGRKGILDDNGYTVNADNVWLLSELDDVHFGQGSVINSGSLFMSALKTVKIGSNSFVNVVGPITMISIGDFSSSDVKIKQGSNVNAESLYMEATRTALIGLNVDVDVNGTILIISTGDTSNSDAKIKQGSDLTAGELLVKSPRSAIIGDNVDAHISGDMVVNSTGNHTRSQAKFLHGSKITVGGNLSLTSGNKAVLGLNTNTIVTENFHMNAQTESKCKIKTSATYTAGSTSGNCLS